MNKRNITIIIAIVSIILVILLITFCNFPIKNNEFANEVKDESNLDILVNLGNFSLEDYSESKLLSVAMQIAEKTGLLNEYSGDNYIQYVSGNDLHTLIYEFAGITIEAPIEIEDFYYLYDSENDYYYCRPTSPINYSVKEIGSFKKRNFDYDITCSISMTEDLEEIVIDNVEVYLTFMPNNNFAKYRVNEIVL